MATENYITTGGYLCGEVRNEMKNPLHDIVSCHYSICQRLHCKFGSYSKAGKVNITITKDDGFAWYKSSDVARRGFCRERGSTLFWEPLELDATAITPVHSTIPQA